MTSKILIVDDNSFDRAMLTKALKIKGQFSIVEASSGEDCLEKIKSNPDISLILLDILMPGITGIELLKQIRKSHNELELPIIMVTSKTENHEVVSCLKDGANDYITKPVNFEIAVYRISTHLKIAMVSKEMSKLKEAATLGAIIATYNHEINNPLTIALSLAHPEKLNNPSNLTKLNESLWRIAGIVKKIEEASQKEISFEDYTKNTKMLKIK